MSIFPAYIGDIVEEEKSEINDLSTAENSQSKWLKNTSFAISNEVIQDVQSGNKDQVILSNDDSNASTSGDEITEDKKTKKHKKRKKCKSSHKTPEVAQIIEFNGHEDYYIDKKPAKQYNTIQTLHKPACPRYRCKYSHTLGRQKWSHNNKMRRYYQRGKGDGSDIPGNIDMSLHENDYTLLMGQLNKSIAENPSKLKSWLDIIELQDRNPYRWSRLILAEKKTDLIMRAIGRHPKSEILHRLYIETINSTYPAFEVSKILEDLLHKDPYNYILWTGQIMATQGSMARCIVPDVLRIYERCMQKMYKSHNLNRTSTLGPSNSDEVMMKLFFNCALFLRQAGLFEQFFALIKLALELNASAEQFGNFAPQESDQQLLIEYEELILQSGLPMNEIWLRIEKLRQGFNFLPCPENTKSSDPQRIVFNEDVCHYIYPLKTRENSFFLMLLIMRLIKLPFVQSNGLEEKFCARLEHLGDSDAVEDVLSVCIRQSFALPKCEQDKFLSSVYEVSKEMVVNPTFLSNCIGHEIYVRCISDLLLNCAEVYINVDERKRIVFILLWCRFQRLLMILEKYGKKLTSDYVKAGRSRFKALLKKPINRKVLNFYTELAIYEYEALDSNDLEHLEPVKNIFQNLIETNSSEETQSSDLCHTFVTYAEILISRGLHEVALQVLVSYVLRANFNTVETITSAKKLLTMQKIKEKLDSVIKVETNVEIMVPEQYLLPDHTISLLKIHTYLQYLQGQKLEAISYLEKLLKVFQGKFERHKYLKENIYEILITTMQLPCEKNVITHKLVCTTSFAALNEFPRNSFFLLRSCLISTIPWYKVRASLLNTCSNVVTITFLVALARFRFIQSQSASFDAARALILNTSKSETENELKYWESIVRNRILNIFQKLTQVGQDQQKNNTLHRNPLFWRLYLRCLTDQNTAFETSKKCLLTALDEVPWCKALYLDGATYVPQELTHLQDLIIEKQLRIYALPEELEILRTNQD